MADGSEREVTVRVETETPGTPEPSVDRTIGQLETETEHLAEEFQEVSEQLEEVQDQADQAETIAQSAAETAWDARAEVERLRSEMETGFSELRNLLSEAEDDQESSTEEIILPDPPEAEPMPEVKTSKIPSWLI